MTQSTHKQPAVTRRHALKLAIVATVSAATAPSLLAAIAERPALRRKATARVPLKATMQLADGRQLLLTRRGSDWYARIADSRGRIVSNRASGRFQLRNGKPIGFDRNGRVVLGGVSTRSFLQCIDPPDCGG